MSQNENDFVKSLITDAMSGKKKAIHAYDRMIWTVRSGFLTLVFAGWGLLIKGMVDNKANPSDSTPYIFILAAFSLALAIGAYRIDLNYVKRKFRVIAAINLFAQTITTIDLDDILATGRHELAEFLKISGDAKNESYRSGAYEGESMVSKIIYAVPSALIIGITFYQVFNQ